jgi:HAD superfamily hydrolase (TIGR01509 family)
MALRALIFDCDGTLAETEECHRSAFNRAFADAGLDWHWSFEHYRKLLRTTGGKERIARYMAEEGLAHADIPALHLAKNAHFVAAVAAGTLELRPGVQRMMCRARDAGLAIAIATTTSRSNLDALIAATPLADVQFATLVTGEDVKQKKPHPEVYTLTLTRLGLAAEACVAFEDSQNGLRAALAAGIPTIATPGLYTVDDDFSGALCVTSLETFDLALLAR